MKKAAFLACAIAFAFGPQANAQTDPAGEEAATPAAAAPEGAAVEAAEEAQPELGDPTEAPAADEGDPEPQPSAPAPSVAEDLAASEDEVDGPAPAAAGEGAAAGGAAGEAEEGEEGAAGRLAAANPTVEGINWSMPTNLGISSTLRTFAPGAQTTYNPTVTFNFGIRPRYMLPVPGLSVGANIGGSIELTQSDFADGANSVWFNDPQIDLTYTLPVRPAGFIITGSPIVRIPISEISQRSDHYLGLGGRVLVLHPVPVASGLILGAGVSYNGWISGSNVGSTEGGDAPTAGIPGARAGANCRVQGAGPNGLVESNNCAGGLANIAGTLSAGVFGTLVVAGKLQLSASFTWIGNHARDLADVRLPDGQVLEDNSDTKWRHLTSFGLSVGYDVLPYLTTTVGYSTLAFHPDSDGTVENMLWNENSVVSLSFQFRPAALAGQIQAANAAEEAEAAEEN